jgi:hypothetical protein
LGARNVEWWRVERTLLFWHGGNVDFGHGGFPAKASEPTPAQHLIEWRVSAFPPQPVQQRKSFWHLGLRSVSRRSTACVLADRWMGSLVGGREVLSSRVILVSHSPWSTHNKTRGREAPGRRSGRV